jgi:serine phosphatase RsbU (regulator of sigma subunit)
MGASPSWLQTYTQSNGINFISIKGTSLEKLKLLYKNNGLLLEIKTTEHPIVYPNISDNFQLNRPVFESLCVVPIKFSDKLLGHLIVGNENPYFFDGDDLSLLSTYVDTLCIALEGNQLLNETIKNEQYKKELQIAKEIQYTLLPKDFPNHPKLEIELFFKPSEEVGGDFYDFIELDPNRLLILIGDVSGKGISASYYMMLLKGIILSSNVTDKSMIDLIVHINQSLINKIDKQIHITMAGLLFDFKNNTAEYIRAGHLPLLISSNGKIEVYKPSGIGLSIVKTDFLLKHLTTEHISLADGTYLLMFTDGLVEALGNKNINVGIEKLKQILKESVFRNANELKELILGNVYESGTIFDDDITLMVFRYM